MSLPTAVASDSEEFVSVLKRMPLDSLERRLYRLAYSQSFRNLFEVLTGFAVLGMLISLLVNECSMNRNLESVCVPQYRVDNELEAILDQSLSEVPESGESKSGERTSRESGRAGTWESKKHRAEKAVTIRFPFVLEEWNFRGECK